MIVPLYAGLLAFIYVFLSVAVIRRRRAAGVAIGDGGDARLSALIRAHGNFSEYAPFALLLLFFIEMQAAAPLWSVHALAVAFCVGRLSHAFALMHPEGPSARLMPRVVGMTLTFSVLLVSALLLVAHAAVG